MGARQRAPRAQRRAPCAVRRSARARASWRVPSRASLSTDARLERRRRLRKVPRRSPREPRRSARRRGRCARVHLLPRRRSARLRHVPRRRGTGVSTARQVLFSWRSALTSARGACRSGAFASGRPRLRRVPPGAGHGATRRHPRDRCRRRAPRRADGRGEPRVLHDRRALHRHVPRARRCASGAELVRHRGPDGLRRLPRISTQEPLRGSVHRVPLRGRRARHFASRSSPSHEWQSRPRRWQRYVRRLPREWQRSDSPRRRARGPREAYLRCSRSLRDMPRGARVHGGPSHWQRRDSAFPRARGHRRETRLLVTHHEDVRWHVLPRRRGRHAPRSDVVDRAFGARLHRLPRLAPSRAAPREHVVRLVGLPRRPRRRGWELHRRGESRARERHASPLIGRGATSFRGSSKFEEGERRVNVAPPGDPRPTSGTRGSRCT